MFYRQGCSHVWRVCDNQAVVCFAGVTGARIVTLTDVGVVVNAKIGVPIDVEFGEGDN